MSANTVVLTLPEFVPAQPKNLPAVFATQTERYMAIKAYDALGSGEVEYRRMIGEAVGSFIDEDRWNFDQVEIGLLNVAVFDPRLLGEFYAKVGGVTRHIDPDECANYEGVLTPGGVYVAQFQMGKMHPDTKPCDFRVNHNPLEQGMTVKEGLNVLALGGSGFLKVCYSDLSGSSSPDGGVPCLSLDVGKPYLAAYTDGNADPCYGSASRGS